MSRKVFSHKVLIKVLVTTNKELCIYIQSQMNKMLNAVITDCFYLLKQDTQTEQFVSSCIHQFSGGGLLRRGEGGAFHLKRDAVIKSLLQSGNLENLKLFHETSPLLACLLNNGVQCVCEVIVLIFSLHNALN